jgi:hypothetical protein
MLQLIDDQTASKYFNEIDTATGDDLQSKTVALEAWANNKKAERTRQEWDHVSKVFTDFDNYSAAEGLDDFDEESRYQYANRKFIANQTGDTPENQMFVYPSKRDEVTDKMFGKTGLSEKEAFDLFKGSIESRNASEEALRELPGVLAQGVLKRAGEGKPFDEVDSWFAFSAWKERHADKLASMPKGWETAMLDSAVKLHARTEQLMDDVAPESKRAMDTLMKFTRPEDATNLPDADRADVENLAKDFAKLTPEQRDGIYATLSYAAEAGGAGMGKGFWEKVGEGIARGGGNIYDDAAITAQDRQARQNITFFQDLLDKPEAEPDRMQTADSIQMQRDMAQKGLEENKQRLGELRVMREIRDLAQGRIDPIKTEMDGVLGQVVQGAYDFSQSAAYTGMAMVPYVGLPAVMGALANSNYLRMLDQYPDMDADAAFDLSLAIAGPQAVIERFQGGLLLGKLPFLGKAMKKLTDVRVPLPVRIGLGFGAVVGLETGTELIQEAMPVVADLLAAAVREDMPEFDANKAWGEYREQAPKIFYSMLWGGLMGGGAVGIRELERSGIYMRNLQELEMHGITGEAAQNIAAEQNKDAATTLFREAWDKRSPEDIQAGIAKRAAMLDAAQSTQANPDLPTRRIEENPDGTLTHIIEQNGQAIYSTNDPAAADLALVNFTSMVDRGRITGTTNGIVEALSFFNQVNEAAKRGDDIQKFILENTPRNLLDEYEANPTEQNLDNLFKTVATIGQDISEPAELANFPVLASNQGALAEGIFKSVIRIYEGATGDKVVRDVAQDNLKRAIAEGRIKMEWVRENLNQIIPQIESNRISQKLRTETDTDVIESFSDVALAYMTGRVREEQIPAGFRGFLRRMAIVVKDIFRRAYKLKRLVAEGKVDANFETLLADSVGLNQQARVDTASNRVSKDIITDGGQMLMDFSIGSRTNAVSTDTHSIRASNATITGPANYSIGAFHGTPHKVDKFSTEKIGTGEAAQAFGWGLYFAENITVAENYARGYRPDHLNTPERVAAEALRVWRGNVENAIDDIKANDISGITLTPEMQSSAVDLLKRGERPKSGNLYTVEINAEPEDLLDWDKPLSEQSPKVQVALAEIIAKTSKSFPSLKGNDSANGQGIYNAYSQHRGGNTKAASEALLAAGIKGIRYLDGGSRGSNSSIWQDGSKWAVTYADPAAGQSTTKRFATQAEAKAFDDSLERTYNYVAFDENLIKITEENGNRIAAADAFATPATGATNYSIGIDSNDSLDYRIADGGSAITASQKIARDLGASSRAIQKAQPSTSSRDAELKAIRDSESIPWYDIGAFGQPDTVASEHQIWFDEGQVYKATAYGRFGHSIEKGPGNALPLEYLRRIAATNEAFDDSARIFGKFEDNDGNLGLIHVQDFIPENPENPTQPTPKQIIQFLESRGFFPAEGRPTNYEVWINPDIGIEVTDLHPGNLIVDATGKLVPIDVIANKYDSTKGVSYSIASQSEIDRVNRALGGMNRGPDERLKVYQRARQSFSRVMQENKEELDAIRSSVSTNTAPAIEQIEMDRAGRIADIEAEENTEVAKALQDNADTFLPRIEAAPTPAERKRVERDAKDRAKILEQGIRDKYAERKKSTDAEAKSQRDQTLQAAAAKDSAANARMRDKVRQTKLVDAIGELDGILKALPPEVRGRVGGFAVLANIGTGDKALADFFVKRIDMIDRQLERTLKEEYGNVFDALLERTKPKKAAAGEKPKGIGADIQSLFAVVREARDWSAEKVDGHIANIETQIASGNLTAEEEAMLTREADLVSLAGDWKNADSSRRAAALSAATETWAKGMSAFVQKKIREREDRDMARAEAISATGKKGDYVGRRKRSAADNGLRGKVHGWFMDTLAWDGVVNMLFGHESPMAIRLSDGQRKAEYAKIDAVAAKEESIHDLFTKLANGNRAAGEKLMWQMSQPSISANGLNLSELEALSATMLWMQEDGRRHMEGELNENGMPVGKWHYDQKFIDDIESALSPEAKTVRDYLLDSYGKEWFSINSVYREMNGINLPRIQNYSPVTVVPINAPAGMVTDPVTGNSVSATSISPGALRTRGTAIAEPAFRNVVQTYLAHTRQMEHWKAFAPWIKEANGILRFRDVQNSIKEAGGEEATGVLNRYLDAFSQGGNRDASLGLEISQVLNRMASRAAQVALIGRVGTLAIQTTQIGAASAELPMGAYVYRLGKLLTGNLGWGDSLNSAYIQRRLKQMPPIVQIAMEGLKAGKPNQLKHQVEKIGRLISGSDALWTAGTYAMVYDYNLSQAKTLGYTGKAAEDYAHNTAERITDRLAQPTRMGAKSIYEVTATNPGSRLGWAFASEARKNLALLAYTKANRPLKRFGATALGFIVFNLAMGAFIRNAWKDIRDDGDDEDEFFDSKTWNWKRIGVAMATEPLQGIPYLGDYTEKGINAALGQYHQSSDLISFERGVRAIKNIPDIVQGEREMADVLKDIDGMVSLMGLFDQNAAAAASLTHIASDFFGALENATED